MRIYRAVQFVEAAFVADSIAAAAVAVAELAGNIVFVAVADMETVPVVAGTEAFGMGIVAAGAVPEAGFEAGHIENWEMRMEMVPVDDLRLEIEPAAVQSAPETGCSIAALFAEELPQRSLVDGTAIAGSAVAVVTAVQEGFRRDSRSLEKRLAVVVLERVVRYSG